MLFLEKLKKKYIEYLLKKLYKNPETSVYCKNSTTKHSMTASCTLKLSAQTELKKKEINEKLKNIMKKYIDSPEKLIQYLQLKGNKVYRIKNANKILSKFGEEEGFLTPLKGKKAFVLNLILGILCDGRLNISFETTPMFIFDSGKTEIYTIARALYKHQGYKNNLPGYDYKSQEIFKKVYQKNNANCSSPFENCTIKEMFSCKEAIARDLESINFTVSLALEYQQSKKALAKIIETNSAKV